MEGIHERGPCVTLVAAGRNILFSGRTNRVWYTQRQMSKQTEVMHFLLWHLWAKGA